MGKRKEFIGTVISDKMKKTIVVRITQVSKHAKYDRLQKQFNKFKVHDQNNSAKIGDMVKIQETRPISKDKHFRLLTILNKAHITSEVLEEPIEKPGEKT